MMHLGYNTNGFAHHRLDDAILILADLGYTSVAITLDVHALNPFTDMHRCDAINKLLERLGMRCVIETGARFLLDPRRKHQPTLLSADPTDRERRFDFLQRATDIAQRLNADAVSFWSGLPDSEEPADVWWSRLVDGCRRLCEKAEPHGIRLAFEPEPGMLIDTMPTFAELHRLVCHPLFGLTLDVGHLHCQGELPIGPHIHAWKKWLWNIHIEDMVQGVHDHRMFGEGEMDFPPIFQALAEIDYQHGVHVELSRHSHDAVNSAQRSITFLRSLVNEKATASSEL